MAPAGVLRVEIVGLAGTGKSTLARSLADRHTACHAADFLHVRSPGHWRYVVHSVPRVVPLLAKTARPRPALSWDEVKLIIYVSEWSRYLRARRESGDGIAVLDQGPLFALACLLWGGKPATRSPRFLAWVAEMVAHWSSELGLIVWLDATDDVLLGRINDRVQRHEAKDKATGDALELLRRHRDAYRQVFGEIARLGRPQVCRIDTSARQPEQIAAEVGRLLEELGWLTDQS